jgi:hypothetical protein
MAGTMRSGLTMADSCLQPRIGHLDDADVGLDRAERVVFSGNAGLGQRIEQGGFPYVGQAYNAALQSS